MKEGRRFCGEFVKESRPNFAENSFHEMEGDFLGYFTSVTRKVKGGKTKAGDDNTMIRGTRNASHEKEILAPAFTTFDINIMF